MSEKFEMYAIVELFGHTRIAGTVTEQAIGGATFIRVDVPSTDTQPAFTRLLNPSAIYAINPVTQEVAFAMAESIQAKPIQAWDIRDVGKKMNLLLEKPNQSEEWQPEEDNDF